MKKYKKKKSFINEKSQLLQIRLPPKEYEKVLNHINKFGVTRREWILTAVDSLDKYDIINLGRFIKIKK